MTVALLVSIVVTSVTLDVSDPWGGGRSPTLRFDIDDPWSDATPKLDHADPWHPAASARRGGSMPRLDHADPWVANGRRSGTTP